MSHRLVLGASVALALVVAMSAVALADAVSFPPSIYPAPVRAKPGAAFTACPNPSGLAPFSKGGILLAERIAAIYGKVSLAADLKHSDRSWWPALRKNWRLVGKHGRWIRFGIVRGVQLGGPKMYWSAVVGYYCGRKLLADSLNVFVGRGVLLNCDCNGVNLLFVDRRGTPLVYDVH